jgi:hypothetical protein
MKFTAAFKWFGFGKSPPPPAYPRWPKYGEAEPWMRGKIAHFRKHYPDLACNLFDISCADYLPLCVHVGGSFGPQELAKYRILKDENPDLVEQASKSTGHRFSRSRVCDPRDWPDEPMYP